MLNHRQPRLVGLGGRPSVIEDDSSRPFLAFALTSPFPAICLAVCADRARSIDSVQQFTIGFFPIPSTFYGSVHFSVVHN